MMLGCSAGQDCTGEGGKEGTLFPRNEMVLYTVSVLTIILGDPAYPLLPWLMKLYPDIANPNKREFNFRLSRHRTVVECTFGCQKACQRASRHIWMSM